MDTDQQIPSPGEPPKEHRPSAPKNGQPPSWIPAWMSDRERMAAIIALGLIFAAFVFVCGGCCSGVMQMRIADWLR